MGSGSRIKDRKLDKFGHSFLVKQEAEASSSHCRFERHIPSLLRRVWNCLETSKKKNASGIHSLEATLLPFTMEALNK